MVVCRLKSPVDVRSLLFGLGKNVYRRSLRVNGSIPCLQNTDRAIYFICKEDIESMTHFFLEWPYFRNNSLWNKLKLKIVQSNKTDSICNFTTNLDGHSKVMLLLGGLALLFDDERNIQINRFIFSALCKVHNHQERLGTLKANQSSDILQHSQNKLKL